MAYLDYQGKDQAELQGLLAETRGALHELVFKHSIGQLKNVRAITLAKKSIAHLMTALKATQVASATPNLKA